MFKFVFQFMIPIFHHTSRLIQIHLPVYDLSKQMHTILCTDGDEIKTFLQVIIPFQAEALSLHGHNNPSSEKL